MFLTIKEVAKTLKISLSMVYAMVSRGELVCYEIGSCKRVKETDLLSFIEERRREQPNLPRSKGRHF